MAQADAYWPHTEEMSMRTTREVGIGAHRQTLASGVRFCREIPAYVLYVLVISACLALLTPASVAQVAIEVTHTYPFSAGRAVVSEKSGSNPAVIYSGHGSGVHVLQTVHPEPSLKSGVANALRPGGLVRDLSLTADHLYVAAQRGGLARYTRSQTGNEPEWVIDTDAFEDTQPWAVAVATNVDDTDLVFVGTNDDYYTIDGVAGGSLHLVWAETGSEPAAPAVRDSIDIGFPVYSVATMVDGDIVTLLVGTACRQVNGTYASLLRYDFDISSSFPTSFPTPVTWNPDQSPLFIRDIVIDPVEEIAYVAGFTRGVFAVDLAGTNLTTLSGDWPITAGSTCKAQFDCLALHGSPGEHLVVGQGPQFSQERTEWGACTVVEPCDDASGTEKNGVLLVDISSPSQPTCVGSLQRPDLLSLGLSVYEQGSSLVIPVATLTNGMRLITATPAGGGLFDMSTTGAWDKLDKVPTGTFDDVLVLGNTLFASFEKGLAAFDYTIVGGVPAVDLLDVPVDTSASGGVTLAGYAASGDFPSCVFAPGLSGISIYEIEGEGPTTTITPRGLFHPQESETLGARTYTANTLSPDITPDGFPWLIAHNLMDDATACETGTAVNGSIRIYRVDVDENGAYSVDTITQLGAWLPDACTEASGALIGGYAYFLEPDTLKIIAGYTPRGTAPNPVEADAGAVFLTFEFQAGGLDPSDDSLTLTSVTKAPAFEDAGHSESGGYFSDAHLSHGIVAGAFSCNGVATFSLSDSLLQTYTLSGTPRSSFLDCAFGSDDYLHCTTLDGEIWVFDPTDMSEPIAIVETRDQAAALYPTTSTGTGSPPPAAFFLADFKGGLHRIQYTSVP